jgi:predicted DNA-binding WGR domain protein
MSKTFLEYVDDKSSKFYEISSSGKKVTIRYGKIGTDGQVITKELASVAEAKAQVAKLILEKIRKGYENKINSLTSETATTSSKVKTAKIKKIDEKKSIIKNSKLVEIVHYVSISIVNKNVEKKCSWFGSHDESEEAFAYPDFEIDLFFDEKNFIVAAILPTSRMFFWGDEISNKKSQVATKLADFFGDNPEDYSVQQYFGSDKLHWYGDARDLPDDQKDDFHKLIKNKKSFVVWKQIRSVDWSAHSIDELQNHIDQGDVTDYSDVIGVFVKLT